MENRENLLGVLRTIFKWKRQIITVCLLTAIGSILISLLLSNYYQSTTAFYSASPTMANPDQLYGQSTTQMYYYGSDEDNDRLLTIARSDELFSFLIDKYNLYEHYEINTNDKKAPYKVRQKLGKLYNVIKTKYEAIELSVEDKDPEIAAQIANAARFKINEIAQKLLKNSQKKLLDTYQANIRDKQKDLKIVGDSLIQLRQKYGIYNSETQGEVMAALVAAAESNLAKEKARLAALKDSPRVKRDTIMFINARIKGLEQQLNSLTSSDSESNFNLQNYNEGLGPIAILEQSHMQSRERLSYDQERYQQLKSAYESDINALHVVEEGKIPIVKSRPKRSIIVLAVTFIAFIFSIIGVLLIDTYRDVNWKEIIYAQ